MPADRERSERAWPVHVRSRDEVRAHGRSFNSGTSVFMNSTIRKFLLPLHRWTGFTVGLVIVLMAVSGAGIVFRPQLEPILNRDLLTVPACIGRASLDVLTATAVAAHPAATPDFIRLQAGEDDDARIPAAMIRFTDEAVLYLNPCSGALLGQRHRYGGLLGTVEQIHRFRFIEYGDWLAGTSAILFGLVTVVGGLCLWWPATPRALKGALRFNPRLAGPARTAGLHKTVGLYAGLILLVSVLTGLPQAFDWYKRGLYTLTGSAQPARPPATVPAAGAMHLPMESLWQRAQTLVPQPRAALLHYPRKAGEAVEAYLVTHDAPHANARTMLYLDPYTGMVLGFTPYAKSSAGHKLYFWMLSLHTGRLGGPLFQLLQMVGALSVPLLAYTGISTYVRRRKRARASGRLNVRVAKKCTEAQGICTFELVDPKGRALPSFAAGAHIDVHLREGVTRQYSLCNNPRDTHRYLICVQREANSRGGSRAMHEDIQQGQIIEIGSPKNRFPLDPAARRSLLIAGGIGVTPILSMAEALADAGADFEMHYCTRTTQRAAFLQHIKRAPYASRVSFHFSDGPPDQLIDIAALLRNPESHTHLYACGPIGFLNVVLDAARQHGWPEHQIHKEYFSAGAGRPEHETGFDIKLAGSGRTLHVAENKTVLEVLSECGIDVPHACRRGICGTCLTRVLEGEPDHRDLYLTEAEHNRNDQFTPCCSRARSPLLVLDI